MSSLMRGSPDARPLNSFAATANRIKHRGSPGGAALVDGHVGCPLMLKQHCSMIIGGGTKAAAGNLLKRLKTYLLDLAAVCEEAADNIEDRLPGG